MSPFKKIGALLAAPKENASQLEAPGHEIYRFAVIEQSFELMKIALHMTIASLLFERGLLPENTFGERALRESLYTKYNYSNFIRGKSKRNFQRNRLDYVPIRVIERHMSDEADKFLDLLENRIFDALLRGTLHAVQFTVLADKKTPENVLESYTFSFDYSGERGTADRLTNCPKMGFVDPKDDAVYMRNVIRVGKALSRRLIKLCAECSALSNERSLGVHVFYQPECADEYPMPGFSGDRDGLIRYSSAADWKRESRFCGYVDSGFHSLGLRINTVQSTLAGGEAPFLSTGELPTEAVPRSGETGFPPLNEMLLDADDELNLSTDESSCSEVPGSLDAIDKVHYYRSIKVTMTNTRSLAREKRVYTDAYKKKDIFFSLEDLDHHQNNLVHAKALVVSEDAANGFQKLDEHDMQHMWRRPDRIRRSSIPTAEPENEAYASLPMSLKSAFINDRGRKFRKRFEMKFYIRRLQKAGSKPVVKARTMDYVQNRAGERDNHDESLPGGSMGGYRCECDTSIFKITKSIQCASCKYHQHTLCYGYTSSKDTRIPDTHYCYRCLIGNDFDSTLMKELIMLIRMRRTIRLLLINSASANPSGPMAGFAYIRKGFPNRNKSLAKILNCTDDEARATNHSLRQLGILKGNPLRKKKGFGNVRGAKFKLWKTAPTCNTIANNILDPMLLIREYYEIPPVTTQPEAREHWHYAGGNERMDSSSSEDDEPHFGIQYRNEDQIAAPEAFGPEHFARARALARAEAEKEKEEEKAGTINPPDAKKLAQSKIAERRRRHSISLAKLSKPSKNRRKQANPTDRQDRTEASDEFSDTDTQYAQSWESCTSRNGSKSDKRKFGSSCGTKLLHEKEKFDTDERHERTRPLSKSERRQLRKGRALRSESPLHMIPDQPRAHRNQDHGETSDSSEGNAHEGQSSNGLKRKRDERMEWMEDYYIVEYY